MGIENKERDTELVTLALKGDELAFSHLLKNYWPGLLIHLETRTHNHDDAEDLAMESFSKAFSKLSTYDTTYAFSTWLYKIGDNTFLDFSRKKSLHTVSIDEPKTSEEGEDQFLQIEDEGLNPEEELILKQRNEQIEKVIASLKPSYRKLIDLRYMQEKTYEEVSDELQMPIGSVKAKLFRARKLLYEIFKNKAA